MQSEESALQIRAIDVGAQRLRIAIRPGNGEGPPLLLCNGIGASIELVEPFIAALDGVETIAFDAPGVGGSPAWSLAYLTSWAIGKLTRSASPGAAGWRSSSPSSTPAAAAS